MELKEGGYAGTEWNRRVRPETARKLLIGKTIAEVRAFLHYLMSDRNEFIYLEGTSRALPSSRKTRRFLHPKKAVGSCLGIRGPNSKARARPFRCIPRCADWPAMTGRLDGRRSTLSQSFTYRD